MIAEKSHTAQLLIERLSGKSKASFMSDGLIAASLQRLESSGIPNSKVEDYKYCNLDAILRKEFVSNGNQLTAKVRIDELRVSGFINFFIVNGDLDETLSDNLPEGLQAFSFNKLDPKRRSTLGSFANPASDAFVALNTAFSGNGLYLEVAAGKEIGTPVMITYIGATPGEAIVNPRSFVVVGESASLTLAERQLIDGNGKVFTNSLSEKFVSENAKLNTVLLQDQGAAGYSVSTNQVMLGRNAVYENVTVTASGQVVRNNHNVVLAGERAAAHLYGLFSSRHSQLVDNHTLMDHEAPNCESNELYKGLADDKSTGVFNGKIFVRRHAQKTNAYQSSKNILLSDDATINTKPQLEIYADDVKCSHGTSTGRIDKDALFYLNARGIGAVSARKMLLASFANEVIAHIPVEVVRTEVAGRFGGTT